MARGHTPAPVHKSRTRASNTQTAMSMLGIGRRFEAPESEDVLINWPRNQFTNRPHTKVKPVTHERERQRERERERARQ